MPKIYNLFAFVFDNLLVSAGVKDYNKGNDRTGPRRPVRVQVRAAIKEAPQDMKLTFLGAAHEVTGSCYLLQANDQNIMIDCGMEQGKDIYENQPLPLAPGQVDSLLLTHAHIDHSGRIPLMVKNGYRGPVFATTATAELCNIMLRDSAHIQEFEAEWRNRKAKRSGAAEYEPIYTMQDAEDALKLFEPIDYGETFNVAHGVKGRFVDVGHLLGSASIELWVTEGEVTKKLVFSGDIGNDHQPLLKDPQYISEADYVVMESTYGDRSHGPRPDYVTELAGVIQETFDRGGNLVIPSFAVGRTQEMLYFLRQIKEQNLVKGYGDFTVYVDSPLAVEATHIFRDQWSECYDEEARALVQQGVNPISFKGLKLAVSSDDSKAINFDQNRKVILSASGMCEAGRIRHHLKHNLWQPQCTVLFVGYQSPGTLGRALVEGAKEVRLFGETIEVRAQIKVLAGVSGHADNEGLMRWAAAFKDHKPQHVFVTHGEDTVCDIFANRLMAELGYSASAPYNGAIYDLVSGHCLVLGNRKRIEEKKAGLRSQNPVFRRLLDAGHRLLNIIKAKEGHANKELARMASQVEALCEKWED